MAVSTEQVLFKDCFCMCFTEDPEQHKIYEDDMGTSAGVETYTPTASSEQDSIWQ